jgi:hypothetical protein
VRSDGVTKAVDAISKTPAPVPSRDLRVRRRHDVDAAAILSGM